MKKLVGILGVMTLLFLSGCQVNKKAQLQALADCKYDVESVDQVKFNGKTLNSYKGADGNYSMSSIANIAVALFSKELPLEGKINLKITNPEAKKAAVNSFKYMIEIQGSPLFEGTVDQNVNLTQGESAIVPLTFKANIFNKAKEKGFDKFFDEIFNKKSEGFLVLKIKPSFKVAGQNIYYPSYITVDKNFGQKIFKLFK
ncbi:hypothetical protein GQF61_01340 [Sphingobacterium sp. DK4209]|uniref:Late embryogenesis abundant protein LEA-2 subgroup domain-containing protein n=1 Tax=Sphingobacterium zhuxiongii TaxID=2662364 RepID=A0A5Q0Q6X2_9SPHI|nr:MULTISPECIES: hypothetical protein [unclassified Sphingobacterium]MVZ64481.1 hypothetical protein [Sphingobacterium sp. DK4209]QGA25817.1 hypothetical protein GFH32_05550 [Sphingobacterium sp. dk4302]